MMEIDTPECIALFTDFGEQGPYLGQVEMALHQAGARQLLIRLFNDAPAFDPRASAYLLAALVRYAPLPTLFLCVVDPGVGGRRKPLMLKAGHHCYVGPDNGLLSQVARQAVDTRACAIDWVPPSMSASFHGRDLFAPVAARIASGQSVPCSPLDRLVGAEWPDDLSQVIYLDHYGNACTGIRSLGLEPGRQLLLANQAICYARTFCEVPVGSPFWYGNSMGLVEIAVNQGRADVELGLFVGSSVELSM